MANVTKVLVVDDEHTIADTLAIILNKAGFNASAVYSGTDAVEVAKSVKPDLIISDVAMPDMNGIEAMILVRGFLPTCKVLLFSGHASTVDLLADVRARGHHFDLLAKPVHPQDLIARLTVNAKRKVFVVDDDEQIADVVSFRLREAEFEVETFYEARSAQLRAGDCLPDILVSDIDMPEMDGITLAETLRTQNPNCKIILMSGNAGWKTRGHLQADGSDDFLLLRKPFSPSHLLRLIKSEHG